MSDFAPMHGALPLIESPFCHLILAVLTILRSRWRDFKKTRAYLPRLSRLRRAFQLRDRKQREGYSPPSGRLSPPGNENTIISLNEIS